MTYLIAVGGFLHIVANSIEAFLLIANGELGLGHMVVDFLAPVPLGNIVGGIVLFTLIGRPGDERDTGRAGSPTRAINRTCGQTVLNAKRNRTGGGFWPSQNG